MIELFGRVYKDPNSDWWISEIPSIDLMSQGKSKKEAVEMAKDAVMLLIKDSGEPVDKDFKLEIGRTKGKIFVLTATNKLPLFGLFARKMREKLIAS